jgi:predicted aconitase with swiveling domain
MLIDGRGLTAGEAHGPLLLLEKPLSLWGGIDLHSGRIVDRTHPQCGATIDGHILAMPASRGSSSSSSALVELARSGLAPAAILLCLADPILVVGALVADDLYAIRIPIILVAPDQWPLLANDMRATVKADAERGEIHLD